MMKQNFTLVLSLFFISGLFSCSKDDSSPIMPVLQEGVFNYTSDKAHNLNVVYFIPNDVTEPVDYHRRVSEILLQAQDFFGTEMQRNGYGNKTFGLLKDDAKKRIKLIVIKGSKGKAAYPYSGGADVVQQEINDYKTRHPSEFTGDHYLVILPATVDVATGNAEGAGVPFYGYGKFCFALDYPEQDIKYLGAGGTLGSTASKWIGGMIHELGHGLNLPHNRQKFSSEATLGMALMWGGNSTWGVSKTFLTPADCAVLNVNQIFNNDKKTYYGTSTASILEIQASYDTSKGVIVVSGKYNSSLAVKEVLFFNDPNVNNEGTGVNKDYNAIAWTSKPMSSNRFYIEMPIVDLEFKNDNIPYELKVMLVQENGNVIETIYSYTFLNGVPVLNFSTRDEISKQGWKAVSFSSEEATDEPAPNGPITNLIDGNAATYWQSKWSSAVAVYPHEFVIDMTAAHVAHGITITQRGGLVAAIKNVELFTSIDGINFTFEGTYTFANVNGSQYFDFSAPKNFRYFKIVASSAWDGLDFAALAEIGMY
ncbi:discoidin domain-containing protein [Flavobacterium sp. KMS]|uniref:discoidin domain-containing protein n=1 Tax=Flavobacterium sp. KMS TaxID=1566023 RepID=UPI0009DF4A4C|nr:discoidin domain-containing protein [Flavobacterium sp. KMS]